MKYSYPVKYALMPIEVQHHFSITNGIEEASLSYSMTDNENYVIGNIVSKCYVVSEKIKYLEDGGEKKEYEVFFPYQKGTKDGFDRIEPEYNYYNLECLNTIKVDNVYNTREEALEIFQEEAAHLFHKKELSISLSITPEMFDIIMANYSEYINDLKEIEKQIEKDTSDMEVSFNPKKQSVIVMFEDRDKILPISLYSFVNLFRHKPFYVCNVTEEDYTKMLEQIKKTKILDERCRIFTKCEYDQFRYLMANNHLDLLTSIVDCDANTEKGAYYLDEYLDLCYSENMGPFTEENSAFAITRGIKVYTTETYEDVIKYYKGKDKVIDEEQQKKLMKIYKADVDNTI